LSVFIDLYTYEVGSKKWFEWASYYWEIDIYKTDARKAKAIRLETWLLNIKINKRGNLEWCLVGFLGISFRCKKNFWWFKI